MLIAAYKDEKIINEVVFKSDNILIVGGRDRVIEYALKSNLHTIIIVGDNEIKDEHIKLASTNKINVIRTKLNSIKTAKKVTLCDSVIMVSVCLPSDALLQYLPSYLGFSYLGQGVSPHSRPS